MRAICLLAALPLLLGAYQVAAFPYGRTVMHAPALRGRALAVAAPGNGREQRVVAGRTVKITAAGNGHQILVDGRVIATDLDDDRVLIQGTYQGGGKTYVVVAEQSGGTACPSMYQALDLTDGTSVISPQFGNCSDVPRVSITNGELRVSVPAFRAAPAAMFVFGDGRLRR